MSIKALSCLVLAVGLAQLQLAHGHGYMEVPLTRNAMSSGPNFIWSIYNNRNGGNGAGENHAYPPKGTLPGECGDPFAINPGSNVAGRPFDSQVTYQQGQDIDVKIVLTANHGGRHAIRVCPGTNANVDCKRAIFLRASASQPEPSTGPKPGKRYWYLPYIGGNDGWWTQTYNARFKLPDGFACNDGCIVQWIYWASQGCAMPCEPQLGAEEDLDMCGRNVWGNVCNLADPSWEEFRNCADVTIRGSGTLGGGGGGGSAATPSPAKVAAPRNATRLPSPRTWARRSPPARVWEPAAGTQCGGRGNKCSRDGADASRPCVDAKWEGVACPAGSTCRRFSQWNWVCQKPGQAMTRWSSTPRRAQP